MLKLLKTKDKELKRVLLEEEKRQKNSIDLIASENIAPEEVLNLLGSCLTNKYSEGYPEKRYYPGNENYDKIEEIAKKRALKLFGLSSKDWHVNVQAYSGAIANLAVYFSVLKPGDKILSMALSSGGHLSHGSKASFTGKLFDVHNYKVNENYDINYEQIEKIALEKKPKMIVSGFSAYPKKVDFKKIGEIAKKIGAFHLADISHIAGLVSSKMHPSPFPFADFIMTTTQKSLFGPRGAIIFVNKNSKFAKKEKIDLASLLDKAVFPGLQGGPHNNNIAAIASGLLISSSGESKKYFCQVVKNAKRLSGELANYGFDIVGGGTNTHLFLVDASIIGGGFEAEKILEKAGILANRNSISKDSSPFYPSAIRIGTYSVTSRGMGEKEMKKIAEFIYRVLIKKEDPLRIKKEIEIFLKSF